MPAFMPYPGGHPNGLVVVLVANPLPGARVLLVRQLRHRALGPARPRRRPSHRAAGRSELSLAAPHPILTL